MNPGASSPEIPSTLPILPIRGIVAFPLAILPLTIGQARSVKLVDDVMQSNRLIGLVSQRNEDARPAGPEDLFRVGTAAVIRQMQRNPDGSLQLLVQGLERIRVEAFLSEEPYLIGRIERIPETLEEGIETESLMRTAKDLFVELVEKHPTLPDELVGAIRAFEDPLQVGRLLSTTVPLGTPIRQELLEIGDAAQRLRRLVELIQEELAVLGLEEEIASQTRVRLSGQQREFMLRERLRAIQEELGEGGEDDEIAEYRRRLSETPLSQEARKEAERELSRLERIPDASPEHGMLRTWMDWMLSLPWTKSTGGTIDLLEARQILDQDHYDLDKIKERLIEYLAVKKLRDERQLGVSLSGAGEAGHVAQAGPLPLTPKDEARREPILCFVGPPGVGKTSLGQSIARAMGRKFVRISLGGVSDESEIRGHRRTYIGAMPGRFVQALRRAETSDPVFMLDEVDKLGMSFRGDPSAALLEVLDPAQNHTFTDTYLGVPVDLSRVLFICTANTTDTIPPPLLDRMELVQLSGYTEAEKFHIARRFLIPLQIRAHGLREDEFLLDDEALRRVVREYTREAGVRGLERQVASLVRKAARKIGEGANPPIHIQRDDVSRLLGRPRFFDEVAERVDRPGVVTGLAWTPTGGDILFVEAAIVPASREELLLTGMLGDVMRESVQAALTFLRSNARRLGIDPEVFRRKLVHVHVPAGAIPKDGPSAGVAMFAALASAVTGMAVASHVAMTGELTLRGKVLPVGGIREKVLAAHRAGIRTVALPKRNEMDLDEVPEEVRGALRFVLLDSVDELLPVVLPMLQPLAREAGPAPMM